MKTTKKVTTDYAIETWECPTCHSQVKVRTGSGVCLACESRGIWIDPAGGVHYSDYDYYENRGKSNH
jgi:hypothetical protein